MHKPITYVECLTFAQRAITYGRASGNMGWLTAARGWLRAAKVARTYGGALDKVQS